MNVDAFVGPLFGAILIATAAPLALRRVPPNDWYGLRVRATFADPGVWYEANARSGRALLAVGALLVASGVVLPALGVPAGARVAAASALLVLGSLAAGALGWRRANRLLAGRAARR